MLASVCKLTVYTIFKINFCNSGHTVGNVRPGSVYSDVISLRRWTPIYLPNFDVISQSTAEIKLLPLYWNSVSGFDIDVYIVIGMSFCICLPNFVVIGRSSAEL